MLRIRSLRDAHLPDILRIQAQCYLEIEPESGTSLRAKVVASPNTCFLAETGAGPVGYLIAVPVLYPELPALDAPSFESAPDADTLYLHDLAVADAGRGTGAGRALVGAAIDAGRTRGLQNACLVAIQDSERFWRQFGFEPAEAPTDRVAAKLASYGAAAQLMRTAI